MRRLICLTVLLWGVGAAAAQTATGGKIDPTWLRTDAASKTVDFKLVAGLTNNNGGMNFNGFGRGGLVLTVPQGWTVALHFKNEDPNLPHSVEVVPEAAAIPTGPVPPAFEHATTGHLEQGFSTGQGAEIRLAAAKAGAFLIFCAVPAHGAAALWLQLAAPRATRPPP